MNNTVLNSLKSPLIHKLTHISYRLNSSYRLSRCLPALLLTLILSPSLVQAGFFSNSASGFGSSSATGFLPVEQAFRLEGQLKGSTLILTWQVEPEHYLYRSRFQVSALVPEGTSVTPMQIPRGEAVHDEFQGDVEILRGKVELHYALAPSGAGLRQGAVIEVVFQGCAEAGLCYPPHRQQLNLIPQP